MVIHVGTPYQRELLHTADVELLLDCHNFTTFSYLIWVALVSIEYTLGLRTTYSLMGIFAHSFFISPVSFGFLGYEVDGLWDSH